MEGKEIAGAVYPVPFHLTTRFFKEGKTVFVKFLPRLSTRLKTGFKVLFYASQKTKQIVGEGTIASIEFLTATECFAKYEVELFLTQSELLAYVGPLRRDKRMLVIRLTGPEEFTKSVPYGRPITMAGAYVTRDEYKKIVKLSS